MVGNPDVRTAIDGIETIKSKHPLTHIYPMDNEIIVPHGMKKKEWFTVAEFVKGVGTSKTGFNRWLKSHPEFVEKYCQNISRGEVRVRYLILWKGIAAYTTLYGLNRGNQHKKIEALSAPIIQAKQRAADIANREIERFNSQDKDTMPIEQDPILTILTAMAEVRRGQLAMEDRIGSLERIVEQTSAVITTPVATTDGQRKFLNDRVRNYCIQHDLPFHVIWRQVHEHVGKAAIHQYEFRHYQAAIKYVEKMYAETGLQY